MGVTPDGVDSIKSGVVDQEILINIRTKSYLFNQLPGRHHFCFRFVSTASNSVATKNKWLSCALILKQTIYEKFIEFNGNKEFKYGDFNFNNYELITCNQFV